MATPHGPDAEPTGVEDDQVIDITDAELARQALHARLVSTTPEGEPVLDLRDEVIATLVDLAPTGRRIVSSPYASGRPPDLQPGVRVEIIDGGPAWDRAEEFVYDIYVDLGYTEESRERQVEEVAEYRDRSRFHLAVDKAGTTVGTVRTIHGSFDELPVGKFRRIDYSDKEPMCHMSSVVVDPAARSRGVVEHLYRSAWADGVRHGAGTITGLTERWMLDGFRNLYGMPFVPCGVPELYMGGTVIPVTMSTSDEAMGEVARANPEFWWWNLEELTEAEIEGFGFTHLTRTVLHV